MNACIGHLNGSYPLSKLSHVGLNRDIINSTVTMSTNTVTMSTNTVTMSTNTVTMSTNTVHWTVTQKELHEMRVTFWKVFNSESFYSLGI